MEKQKLVSAYHNLLPKRYTFMKELGEGCFGTVVKCLDTVTRDIVAVKLSKSKSVSIQEVTIMRQLMDKNMDDCNIVKFYDSFNMTLGPALVFEILDISLEDYIFYTDFAPMLLDDIRTITKQVATALNTLQSVQVIHTDIKPANVMLVNRKRPFKVKLIDFGLAMQRSQARPGMTLQAIIFRSPEIHLGLPFSEAIDMWALGHLVFIMLIGEPLILAISEYQAMKFIVDLLGVPPDDLLNQGVKTHRFFTKTESDTWRLKTPEEYLGIIPDITISKCSLYNLDDLKKIYKKRNNKADPGQTEQCIQLFKAMLAMDKSQRITPLGVLSHPFITQDDQQEHRDDLEDQDHQDDQDQKLETDEGTVPPPTAPLCRVIQVRPASTENTLKLEDEERADSLQDRPDETFKVSCHSSPPQSPAMTSEDSEEEEPKKKKKKKSLCQRFCSWLKRTFCCNRVGVIG